MKWTTVAWIAVPLAYRWLTKPVADLSGLGQPLQRLQKSLQQRAARRKAARRWALSTAQAFLPGPLPSGPVRRVTPQQMAKWRQAQLTAWFKRQRAKRPVSAAERRYQERYRAEWEKKRQADMEAAARRHEARQAALRKVKEKERRIVQEAALVSAIGTTGSRQKGAAVPRPAAVVRADAGKTVGVQAPYVSRYLSQFQRGRLQSPRLLPTAWTREVKPLTVSLPGEPF